MTSERPLKDATGFTGRSSVNALQASPYAVEATDLSFSYGRGQHVLRSMDFAAPQGQITMVIGASGSGKTTLLKLVKGLLPLQEGRMTVLRKTYDSPGENRHITSEIAYIPQHLGLVRSLTVLQNALTGALGRLGLPYSLFGGFPHALIQEAKDRLTRIGLGEKIEEKVYNLSGGERQRVAIIRARMQNPRLILADEFVSQLDTVTTTTIMDALREQTRNDGVTYIQTTHELDLVLRFADRVSVISSGKVVLEAEGGAVDRQTLSEAIRS
ncbi:MAG: ATP-binding cassette domain-containing protein [Dehalococcoidia bacterium]|nr:ATP-binding cassette domain-containing protein [Dehalococcoidia bacterium]